MMNTGKSIGRTILETRLGTMLGTMLLIGFGLVTMFGGEKWLVALIPAATLVWYGTGSALRRDRN